MNLADVMYQMMSEHQQSSQPADLRVGTVTATNPLEITINTAMAPLRSGILLLTSAVVEKKIPALSHSHSTSGLSHTHTTGDSTTSAALEGSYESDTQLSSIVCYENGAALPVQNGYIILNRALAVGDKVLLLRVQNGQKFIVLSRVFEEGN